MKKRVCYLIDRAQRALSEETKNLRHPIEIQDLFRTTEIIGRPHRVKGFYHIDAGKIFTNRTGEDQRHTRMNRVPFIFCQLREHGILPKRFFVLHCQTSRQDL